MVTILVVDDEAGVRETVTKILTTALDDVQVLSAAEGYEALRLLVKHSVDLMMIDVQMPGLNGFQLAQQAKLIQPDLHFIYVSAFYWLADKQKQPVYGPFIHKPFRAQELIQQVEGELSARQRA
jgi:YesN/AraC family two-component response regulator